MGGSRKGTMLIVMSVNSTFTLCDFTGELIPWEKDLDDKQDGKEEGHSDLKDYSK